MKRIYHRVLKFIKKPAVIVLGIIIILVFFVFGRGNKTEALTAEVKKGTIIESVQATGQTKAKSSVNLGFERSGQVQKIYADVGDRVTQGQVLVELERSELNADLKDAEANHEIQLAKLAELKTGASPETIALKKAGVDKAKNSLETAKLNMKDKNQDAFTKTDNAIHNYADQLMSNPKGSSPTLLFSTSNQLKSDIETNRLVVEQMFSTWSSDLQLMNAGTVTEKATAEKTKSYLSTASHFLDSLALAVNSLTSNEGVSQTTIDTYKTNVASARADVNTATVNISAALEKLVDAEADLTIANQELTVALSGGTAEQIKTQEAYVKQAEAKIQNAKAQIGKAILRSPITGIVTKADVEVGEIVAQYDVIFSVIGDAGTEIEAEIPEIDIGRIAIGNPVRITVDAFPGEVFAGHVGFIDPAETIVDGVVNFNIKVFFEVPDARLKTGLTANLTIETMKKSDVLILPRSAIKETNKGAFVSRKVNDTWVETKVTVGLKGEDSSVEIIAGVSEGDTVLAIAQ